MADNETTTIEIDRETVEAWRERAEEIDRAVFSARQAATIIAWLMRLDIAPSDGGLDPRINHVDWLAEKLVADLERLEEKAEAATAKISCAIAAPYTPEPSMGEMLAELRTGVEKIVEQRDEADKLIQRLVPRPDSAA